MKTVTLVGSDTYALSGKRYAKGTPLVVTDEVAAKLATKTTFDGSPMFAVDGAKSEVVVTPPAPVQDPPKPEYGMEEGTTEDIDQADPAVVTTTEDVPAEPAAPTKADKKKATKVTID